MRSDKHKVKGTRKQPGKFARLTRKWSILFVLLAAGFLGITIYSGFLVAKYLTITCAIVGAITLLLFFPLFSYRFKQSRRIFSFCLSLLFGAAYVMGAIYVGSTIGFFDRITGGGYTTDEYYVIVRDDDQFAAFEDLQGETVHSYKSGSTWEDARAQLEEEISVDLVIETDLTQTVDDLLEGNTDVIFLSAASYTVTKESRDSFEDYTKILKTIQVKAQVNDFSKGVQVTKDSYNIYVTGLDTSGDISYNSRSDVNMIITVNPKTKTILLTSIPRDYYVEMASTGEYDKLTHTGNEGPQETVQAAENMLGLEINYYLKVNYSTVISLVDAIDGIDIVSEFEFETHGQDWYYFEAGPNHLYGEEALAFCRERQSFENGDLQRNQNQQIVLAAILEKMTSSSTLLTSYTDILDALGNTMETNMSSDDIRALVRMQQADMASWTIQQQAIIGESDMKYSPMLGDYASVVDQDPESIAAARKQIQQVMNGQ